MMVQPGQQELCVWASPLTGGAASPTPQSTLLERLQTRLQLELWAKQASVSRDSANNYCFRPVAASDVHLHCALCDKTILAGKSQTGALKHLATVEHYLSWYKEMHAEQLQVLASGDVTFDADTYIRKLYGSWSVGVKYKNESHAEKLARQQSANPPKARKRRKVNTRLQHGPTSPLTHPPHTPHPTRPHLRPQALGHQQPAPPAWWNGHSPVPWHGPTFAPQQMHPAYPVPPAGGQENAGGAGFSQWAAQQSGAGCAAAAHRSM
jgi:hypothetical protein